MPPKEKPKPIKVIPWTQFDEETGLYFPVVSAIVNFERIDHKLGSMSEEGFPTRGGALRVAEREARRMEINAGLPQKADAVYVPPFLDIDLPDVKGSEWVVALVFIVACLLVSAVVMGIAHLQGLW